MDSIRKTLDITLTLNCDNLSLNTFVTDLNKKYDLRLKIDEVAIQRSGGTVDELNFSYKCQDIKLRSALQDILNNFNLTYVILNDSVLLTSEEFAIHRFFKQKIDLDLENIPGDKALRSLAKQYGANIVIDPRVQNNSPVTLNLKDVSLESAIRVICEIANIKPVRIGNILFITSESRAEKLKDSDSFLPPIDPQVLHPVSR